MKDKTIRRIIFLFLVITVVLIVVALQAARNISGSVSASDWVNHTHAAILESEAVRASLYVSDGAMHTYVLTGDARDLASCRNALADTAEHLEVAKALTRFEPAQNEEVNQIGSLVSERADFIERILAARLAGSTEKVVALLAADAGGDSIANILRKLDKMKNEELALLTKRDTASYLQAQMTRWTVWAGMAIDVALLGGVAWLIRDDLAARRRVADALQGANERLEARVLERTDELAAANGLLSTENLERRWANLSLEHQLRYNHQIVDSISELVLVLTKAGNISRVNPAVVNLTGMETSALINQPLTRIVQLVAVQRGAESPMRDPVAQALAEGHELHEQPALVEDLRGRRTPVRFALFPLRDRDKVVGGIVTLRRDPPQAGGGA